MLFINKLFNSIACLLSFTNLQLVIPGRTWILLYLGRTVYKRLWACLALYMLRACSEVNLHKGPVTQKNIERDCYLYLLMVESVASQFGGLDDSLDSGQCIRFA